MRWTISVILLASAAYLGVAVSGPMAVGLWQDDAIYLTTAKSLAEGNGYRHIELPGQPFQTKYPILYPAALALCWLIWPAYPQNLILLLTPSALAAGALVVLSAVYVRKVLGASRLLAIATGVLAGLSPAVVSLARFTMSDLPYACVAVLALLVLDGRYESARTPRRRLLWLVGGGALVAAAMLTRGFGVVLAVAAVAGLLLRRRFAHAAVMALVVAACMTPWWLWQVWAAKANGAMQTSVLVGNELSYGLWLPETLGQAVGVAWKNAFQTAFGIGHAELALGRKLFMQGIEEVTWRTVATHGTCYLAAAVAVLGFVSSARKRWRTLHLYAVLYVALMLSWPFQPFRFLTCGTPFLIYFLLEGARTVVVFAARRVRGEQSWKLAWVPVAALAALVGVLFVLDDVRILESSDQRFYFYRGYRQYPVASAQTREWIIENTDPEDVIASAQPAGLFLATGRRGQSLWHDNDPCRRYYGADRKWWQFYVPGAPSERALAAEQMRADLAGAYREGKVTYVVLFPMRVESDSFFTVMRDHPEWLDFRYVAPGNTHPIFRLHLPDE